MKPAKSRDKIFAASTVCLSLLGLVFIDILVLQTHAHPVNLFNRNIVGLFFSSLCILGILAAFYPNKCQKTSSFAGKDQVKHPPEAVHLRVKGHHPDCLSFSGNRIRIGSSMVCSACGGLVFGAIVSLFVGGLYFFAGYNFIGDFWFLVLAEFGVVVGLFQYLFHTYVKLIVNALFVVCSFAVLAVSDFLINDILVDFYVFGMIIFMLILRITFSQFNNKKICNSCEKCVLISS